jgi:hypothetical protein
MRLSRSGDWIHYITPESGQNFFYNERTKEFQWTDPSVSQASSSSRKIIKQPSVSTLAHPEKTISVMSDLSKLEDGNTNITNKSEPECEWNLYEDPTTGHAFWYNCITQVSQWECPFTTDDFENFAEDTRLVQNDDDLGI